MDYLETLNPQQLEAVEATEGYVRVIAGAGTGKTKTLTSRVAYLIDALGIAPENILCVTFTNKAAKEMRNRITNYLGDAAAGAMIMTFGALEARIIREDGRVIGYPANYQIIDEEDKKQLIANVLRETKEEFANQFPVDDFIKTKYLGDQYGYHAEDYSTWMVASLEQIQAEIASLRTGLQTSHEVKEIVRYILMRYVYEKRKSFACDFDDLDWLSLMVLGRSELARGKWQDKLKYIMVDEYQDVSGLEVKMIGILQAKYQNLFIVGDSDQTIYSFRGSDVKYILDFDKSFSPAQTILLTRNYRSGANILQVSNTLIKKNKNRIDKELQAFTNKPGKVVYYHAKNVYDEGEFIADNIESMHNQGLAYNSMAILYRAHHVTRTLEEKLLTKNIPYKVYSGVGFYQRMEVKDMLAYMRLLTDGDDISFQRVINRPRRQAGPKTMAKIQAYAEAHQITMLQAFLQLIQTDDRDFQFAKKREFAGFVTHFQENSDQILSFDHPISDLMMYILKGTQYEENLRLGGEEDRLDNLAEFKQSLVDYENSFDGEPVAIAEYLQNITLLTNQDMDDQFDKVNLMTIHTAKGLEFPVVFVASLNEGVFPSARIKSKSEMEEERRLAYVAFTRAENHLILTDAGGQNFDGTARYPSRFIFDAEKVGIEYLVELDADLLASYGRYPELTGEVGKSEEVDFKLGDQVHHKVFGYGRVTAVKGDTLTVKFDQKPNELNLVKRVLMQV